MNKEDLSNFLHNWLRDEVLALSKTLPGHTILLSREKLNKLLRVHDTEKIWMHVATHVRSRSAVAKIKSLVQKKRHPDALNAELLSDKVSQEEHLKQRLYVLSARRSLLESAVKDGEDEVINMDRSYEHLRQEAMKKSQVCAYLCGMKHVVWCKVLSYKGTAASLRSGLCLTKINAPTKKPRTPSATNPQTLYLKSNSVRAGLSQLTIGNLISLQSYPAVKKMIFGIHNLFTASPDNAKNTKSELLSEICGLLIDYTAHDIMFCLQQEAELNVSTLSSVEEMCADSELSKNTELLIPHKLPTSASSIELHKLVLLHIKLFMDKQKLHKQLRTLTDQSSVALKNLLQKVAIENESRVHAIKSDMSEFVSCQVVSKLKQYLSSLRADSLRIEFKISCEQIDSNEVMALTNQIATRKKDICYYLACNKAIISDLSPNRISYASIFESLESEKAAVKNAQPNLCCQWQLEPLMPLIQSSGVTENSMQLYFQDENVLLDNYLTLLLHSIKCVVASKEKVAQQMHKSLVTPGNMQFSEDDIEKEHRVLKELFVSVRSSEEMLRQCEMLLGTIKLNIEDWWEQPAQFIPHKMLKTMSLKEWKRIFAAV